MVSSDRKRIRRNRRQKAYNFFLILLLIGVMPLCGVITYQNLQRIEETDSGEGTTMETSAAIYAGSYVIGNNPTEADHLYFEELAAALEAGDQKAAAEAVVKDFAAEYYTWTNKDGNYDVGGMQYIYSDLRGSFEAYSRNTFYNQLHRYINEYGRENLIEVKEVTLLSTEPTEYILTVEEELEAEEGEEPEIIEVERNHSGYNIEAKWTYNENTVLDTDEWTDYAVFTVVDHDGRMEIISISNGEADYDED